MIVAIGCYKLSKSKWTGDTQCQLLYSRAICWSSCHVIYVALDLRPCKSSWPKAAAVWPLMVVEESFLAWMASNAFSCTRVRDWSPLMSCPENIVLLRWPFHILRGWGRRGLCCLPLPNDSGLLVYPFFVFYSSCSTRNKQIITKHCLVAKKYASLCGSFFFLMSLERKLAALYSQALSS